MTVVRPWCVCARVCVRNRPCCRDHQLIQAGIPHRQAIQSTFAHALAAGDTVLAVGDFNGPVSAAAQRGVVSCHQIRPEEPTQFPRAMAVDGAVLFTREDRAPPSRLSCTPLSCVSGGDPACEIGGRPCSIGAAHQAKLKAKPFDVASLNDFPPLG